MMTIKPFLKHIDEFSITGLSTRTKNEAEKDPKTAKIPALWQKWSANNFNHQTPIYGVYSDYESDTNGLYTLTVGTLQENALQETDKATIYSSNYLVFSASGPMPETIINIWKEIWIYFSKETSYKRNFISDFEVYQDSSQVEVYIGIR